MTAPRNGGPGVATKAGRFVIVGLANTAIDLAVFWLLVMAAAPPLLANLGAWLVAVSFSYAANSRWSFERNRDLRTHVSVLRFMALGALISLGVSSGAIAALAGLIGLWPAKILGVVVAGVLNFVAARWSIEDRIS